MIKIIKNIPIALVTGGCGFVGRHFTSKLCENAYDVWIVDDLSTGVHPDKWLGPEYERMSGDDPSVCVYQGPTQIVFLNTDVRNFFAGQVPVALPKVPDFEDVFHFAAVVGGRAVIENNPIAVAIDLAIDASFYNWATEARPKRMLYASSSAAYPISMQDEVDAVALRESDIDFTKDIGQPDMTYGWSK